MNSSKILYPQLSTGSIQEYPQGFFQPFWEGALGPFALGNFRHFNRNWEIFFIHFYSIFLNRDTLTALNHSYF